MAFTARILLLGSGELGREFTIWRCHVNCGWPELGLQASHFKLLR
jgi:hypothetical protein